MTPYERMYTMLVKRVLNEGELRETRNAKTLSVFGASITLDMELGQFPLLQGRKMYHAGVLGELAAVLRGPKHREDFEKWGCNYWKKWCKPDGSITVDYGNEWLANGQIDHLKHCLTVDQTNRRMLINGWNAASLEELDLPCCHYSYQFYVRGGEFLDMIWNQRSADLMIGVPSDAVFAYAWLVSIANEFGLMPGKITMNFGDVHIYESHVENARHYVNRVYGEVFEPTGLRKPTYAVACEEGKDFLTFEPSDITILDYDNLGPLEFELYE